MSASLTPEPSPAGAPTAGLSGPCPASPPASSSAPSPAPGVPPPGAGEPAESCPTIISKGVPSLPAGPNGGTFARLLRGCRLAHFEIQEPLGVGGMAAVLKARDLQLDRPVALKVLPPEMAADPENVKRFEHEARAAAKLDHENIARVFYCGADQGLHFIAFEYVEGETLRALIDRHGRLPEAEALHYMLQIATGLVHAAARGVVHRDIKPSNIIIGENGRAKLVDMGLARSQGAANEQGLTHSGVTLGTFDYISPEQALDPRSADVRSDIYSLGCTFYHAVTGQPPVPEGTAARKLHFHQHESFIDPRQLNPELSDETAAVLSRMMAKDPNDRYQRPELLVRHLVAVARKFSGQPAGSSDREVVFVESVLPEPPRPRPLTVLALGVAAVVLLVLALGPMWEPEESGGGTGLRVAAEPPGPRAGVPPADAGRPARAEAAESAPAPQRAATRRVRTAQELRAAADDTPVGTVTLAAGVYDVSGDDRPAESSTGPAAGLSFPAGCDVTLEGEAGSRPVLRLVASARAGEQAIVRLNGGTVTLRGLRLVVESGESAEAAGPAAALLVQAGNLVLEDCEFVQRTGGAGRLAVLHVPRPSGKPARRAVVEAHECAFLGGQALAVLDEGARVEFDRCVIGPFEAAWQLKGHEPHQAPASLVVKDCSALLGAGPHWQIDSHQACEVTVSGTVLSRPGPREAAGDTVMFLVGRDQLRHFTFRGEENYYHGVDLFAARVSERGSAEPLAADLTELTRLAPNFQDSRSRQEAVSPWAEADPVARLASAEPLSAFRLKGGLAALRRAGGEGPLGARRVAGKDLVATETAAAQATPAAAEPTTKELVVDRQGAYKTLGSALGESDAEEEVLITLKVNGPVLLRPTEIGSRRVTIRAAAGCRPELIFYADHVPGADGEAALFKVHDGELALENVGVRLSPLREKDATKLQALVAVTGTGRCRFKGCWATLLGEGGPRMALVTLADPTGSMTGQGGKPSRPGAPSVEMEDGVVRGTGEMVVVRASRPFRLEVRNALVALVGSLLSVEGNKPDAAMPSDGAVVAFDRVTAYLTQSVVALQAGAGNPVHVPLKVASATGCLFAAAEDNPLVRIDGPQSEQELRRRLLWQGKRNLYRTAGALLVWQPAEKADMPHRYDGDRWGELWGRDDDQARFPRAVRFAGFPAPDKTLADVAPADFRVVSLEPPEVGSGPWGADLDRLTDPNAPAGSE